MKNKNVLQKIGIVFVLSQIINLTNCNQDGNDLPGLEEKVPASIIDNIQPDGLLMISASQLQTFYVSKYNNIEYDIAVDDQNIIIYIGTQDSNFVTEDKLRVGDPLALALENAISELMLESGWAYYVELKSGWKAMFTTGPHMTDSIPKPDSPIRLFFKRSRTY